MWMDVQLLNMPSKVVGMICRSTLIPQSDPGKVLVSTQPVRLVSSIVTGIHFEREKC